MTAINLLIRPDAAVMLTDGRGTLTGVGAGTVTMAKVMPLPHLRCAVATRGHELALPLVSKIAGAYRTFDEMRHSLAASLAHLSLNPASKWQREVWAINTDIAVVGWGKDGPCGFLISNHDENGYPPFERFDVSHASWTPAVSAEAVARFEANPDPLRGLVDIKAEQARMHREIGAFVQATRVSERGISTNVIRDWRTPASSAGLQRQMG